jgi:hypothetical protein
MTDILTDPRTAPSVTDVRRALTAECDDLADRRLGYLAAIRGVNAIQSDFDAYEALTSAITNGRLVAAILRRLAEDHGEVYAVGLALLAAEATEGGDEALDHANDDLDDDAAVTA